VTWLEYFKRWASKYEREVDVYGYEPEKLIRPFVPLMGKRKICVDVGCGTGRSMKALMGICEKVIGVEPVEKMARRAEGKGFAVVRLRGEEIGKMNVRADLVTFFASIDYMQVEKVVKGIRRILAKNGFVFLTVEPENEGRIVKAFKREGFEIVKRIEKRAYEGQKYVCLLLKLRGAPLCSP